MLPDFSTIQRRRLKALGVVAAQIEKLRYACVVVRMQISPPAARNEIAAILGDVEKLADKLLRKTAAIARRVSAAHVTANSLMEQGYWQNLPDDIGATSFVCVANRLEALRDAARCGKKQLPPTPSRHRSADPMPVRAIAEALRLGWKKEHGSDDFHVQHDGEREMKVFGKVPQRRPYPRKFRPSAADGSAFRAIVGICYEAMGGNSDPLAAIKAYVRVVQGPRANARAAVEAGIEAVNNQQPGRTSRKK